LRARLTHASRCATQVIAHYSSKVVDIKADRAAKEVEAQIAQSLA
jgi:hypothetical protein